MMLKYATGNLIDMAERGDFHVIVHGCNCFNTMGSGIAKEVRERYPEAYEADTNFGAAGDYNKLGNYSVKLGKRFTIINAYTQYNFNRKGETKDVFEYKSFEMILQKLAYEYPTCDFGFPYIGMGLAGGDKTRIIAMLEEFAKMLYNIGGGTVTLVEFSK